MSGYVIKWSPSEPRDKVGRWGRGGSGKGKRRGRAGVGAHRGKDQWKKGPVTTGRIPGKAEQPGAVMKLFAQITKVDEEKRLVYGRAVKEEPDKADEIFDYATSKPYFEAWSKEWSDDTAGKSLGNVRAMHGKVLAGKLAQIDFNDTEQAIDVAAKILDDGEWTKVLEGGYRGFSIGGSYVGERKTEKIGDKEIKRYTANPNEISLVDSPCVPSAKFFDIVKADGQTKQVEFKPPVAAEPTPKASTEEPAAKAAAPGTTEPVTVRGEPEQVDDFVKLLNEHKLSMSDAIAAVKAEVGRRAVEDMLKTAEELAVEKREFSAEERKKSAKAGHALPDGSFPIENVSDLHNAIQAYGRAKDKAKAKAHIISRARALGASKELPESWTKKDGEKLSASELKKIDEIIAGALSKPLIESDSDEAFSSNVASEVKAGKSQEQAVAIAYSVQRKARAKKGGKKAEDGTLRKGLYTVGEFAQCLSCLCEIARSAEYDLQAEEDDSGVPMKLRNAIDDLIEIFKEMTDEETAELLDELKEHAGVGEDDEIEMALEQALRVGDLKKRLADPALPITELVKIGTEYETPITAKALGDFPGLVKDLLAKAGARHSKVDAEHLQQAHDHLVGMGAQCYGEDGEKSSSGNLAKMTASVAELTKEVEKLKAQPMPHIVQLKMLTKAESNGTHLDADDDWLMQVPYDKLIKISGGPEVDWAASARVLKHLKPTGAAA